MNFFFSFRIIVTLHNIFTDSTADSTSNFFGVYDK